MLSDNLMRNSEEKESPNEELSEADALNLAEWLIFKIKVIYGRCIFEGDTADEALAIRQEWHDLVYKIGKKGILATIDFLLSGHNTVPSFPPSPVEFRKCYRIHVAPFIAKAYVVSQQKRLSIKTKDLNQDGYKKFQELLKKMKPSYLENKGKN